MKIKFWGVRGSLPAPSQTADLRDKLCAILRATQGQSLDTKRRIEDFLAGLSPHLTHLVGGNTPCVEVAAGETRLILDAGSGLRNLGLELSGRRAFSESDFLQMVLDRNRPAPAPASPQGSLDLTFLISHTHWDHIHGLPFFTPAYMAGNRLTFYGQDGPWLQEALDRQQRDIRVFPINLASLAADLSFHSFPAGGLQLGDLTVTAFPLPHPGGCLAYRLDQPGRSLIYATDYEFADADGAEATRFVEFSREADLFISDTQYTYMESVAREGWGHSSSFSALDLALRAGVRGFCLFHHDPEHSDAKLFDNLEKTRAYYRMMSGLGDMLIELAVEGLTITI